MLVKFCTEIAFLMEKGYSVDSDLNYCTESGINYYIGYNGNAAAIVAIIESESNCFINKAALREMARTAAIKGIEQIALFTNYGVELHSRHEKPELVGLSRIEKVQF